MRRDERYLVLGANGFVGSHLVDCLARMPGTLVKAFDRFNLSPQFAKSGRIEIVKGDMYNDRDIAEAMADVDYVIHSFSATTPAVSDDNPYADITQNLLRSVQILDACVKAGVKKVGFISSGGAVYGATAEKKVVDEEDLPAPVSPYGINKLAIEHYMDFFKRKYGLNYVAYRLTNPFGPRQVVRKNQGVIAAFLEKILKDEEVTVYGDGTMSRDYVYIEDAAQMITTSFKHGQGNLYNIGRDEQTSVNDILDEFRLLLGKDIKVCYKDSPKSFLQRTPISIGRYCNEFDVPNFTSLHDGLVSLLKYNGVPIK